MEKFKLEFFNYELAIAISFLQEMKLKASDSRHRTKLVKELTQLHEELVKEQLELIEQFGQRDDGGSLMSTEDGQNYLIEPSKAQEYQKENTRLLGEEVVITGGAYINNIKQMGRVLSEYTGELSGQSAEIYDRLLDEFEKNITE